MDMIVWGGRGLILAAQIIDCLAVVSRLLYCHDPAVIADSCWTGAFLSDGPNQKIQLVINSGIVKRLVELIMCVRTLVLPADITGVALFRYLLQAPGYAHRQPGPQGDREHPHGRRPPDAGGDQLFRPSGIAAPPLQPLSQSEEGGVLGTVQHLRRKQSSDSGNVVLWCREEGERSEHPRNLMTSVALVQAVVDSNIFPELLTIMETAEYKTRKEAAWAVLNAMASGTNQQIK